MTESLFFVAGFLTALLFIIGFLAFVAKFFNPAVIYGNQNEDLSNVLNDLVKIIEDEENMPDFFVYTPDGMAYWLHDDAIYAGEIDEDGNVDLDQGKPVDMNNLSGEALEDFLIIMEKLRGGKKK
jgi:hypothetical protein